MSVDSEVLSTKLECCAGGLKESKTLRVIGWFSAGIAVAALGLFVGSEIRSRYKFRHRTPYDFYSNAGSNQASEFGMGV